MFSSRPHQEQHVVPWRLKFGRRFHLASNKWLPSDWIFQTSIDLLAGFNPWASRISTICHAQRGIQLSTGWLKDVYNKEHWAIFLDIDYASGSCNKKHGSLVESIYRMPFRSFWTDLFFQILLWFLFFIWSFLVWYLNCKTSKSNHLLNTSNSPLHPKLHGLGEEVRRLQHWTLAIHLSEQNLPRATHRSSGIGRGLRKGQHQCNPWLSHINGISCKLVFESSKIHKSLQNWSMFDGKLKHQTWCGGRCS